MHIDYQSNSIRQLRDQQTRFLPRDKRLEQIENAERFLAEVHPERNYNYEFVCFRITGFRPQNAPIEKIKGTDLRSDLLNFIEDLSESVDLVAVEMGQPVYTVDELSKQFNVSTKTISRWRQQGLVSRKLIFDGGRKRVGFLNSSVDRFVKNNREKVRRGEQFSQLTDEDRKEIIEKARRLAQIGSCPAEITRNIAESVNRSVETVRYTIKRFDKQNPDIAIFPNPNGPLNLEMKERIYADFISGKSVETIAKRYVRTRTTIYKVINEVRARNIMELPLDYMDSPEFRRKSAEKKIVLTEMPASDGSTRQPKAPAGLPRYLAAMYDTPLLTREQEQYMFRKYNYLKFKASRIRDELSQGTPKATLMDEIERFYEQAVKTKNAIVKANLRLVISIAKRHVVASEDFFQLVSDGNMSLIRAVEKFDYSRGNKFSTYASWAIMKNFARTIPGEFKQRDRFRPSPEELFVAQPDQRSDRYSQEAEQERRSVQVNRILERLDEREQQIIVSRFGLDRGTEPLTLKEVGEKMGVTKERVRQIQTRALVKLREAAMAENIELSDGLWDDVTGELE